MERIDLSMLSRQEPLKAEGYFEVQAESGVLQLPVFLIQGAPGPRLGVVGAQHSCETCGTDAIVKLISDFRAMEPSQITGSVLLIPVANITGYPLRAHNTSQYDGTNLNRSYPGSPTGNTTQRIAHAIWEIVSTSDYILDLHGGDMNEDIIQYAEIHQSRTDLFQKSLAMASCFQLNVVLSSLAGRDYGYSDHQSLQWMAPEHGIPSAIIEAGGSGISDQASIDYFYQGLKNVMVRLGILRGESPAPRPLWVTPWVSCIERPHRGIFTSFCSANQHVKQGELIGQITNYFGDVIDQIYAPRTGVISLVQSCRGVSEDDLIYMIIDEETGSFITA